MYQPIIHWRSGADASIRAFEALLRVSDRGLLASAGELIKSREQMGNIACVDRWVAQEAGRFLAHHPKFKLWVNASRISLCDPLYVNDLLRLIKIPANEGRLTVEVTESCKGDPSTLDLYLAKLADAGVSIVIDDLWDGYNEESMLAAEYVHGCKLSAATTAKLQLSHQTKVSALNTLSRLKSEGKIVVVEGIETRRALEVTQALGFELFQGWLFGQPVKL